MKRLSALLLGLAVFGCDLSPKFDPKLLSLSSYIDNLSEMAEENKLPGYVNRMVGECNKPETAVGPVRADAEAIMMQLAATKNPNNVVLSGAVGKDLDARVEVLATLLSKKCIQAGNKAIPKVLLNREVYAVDFEKLHDDFESKGLKKQHYIATLKEMLSQFGNSIFYLGNITEIGFETADIAVMRDLFIKDNAYAIYSTSKKDYVKYFERTKLKGQISSPRMERFKTADLGIYLKAAAQKDGLKLSDKQIKRTSRFASGYFNESGSLGNGLFLLAALNEKLSAIPADAADETKQENEFFEIVADRVQGVHNKDITKGVIRKSGLYQIAMLDDDKIDSMLDEGQEVFLTESSVKRIIEGVYDRLSPEMKKFRKKVEKSLASIDRNIESSKKDVLKEIRESFDVIMVSFDGLYTMAEQKEKNDFTRFKILSEENLALLQKMTAMRKGIHNQVKTFSDHFEVKTDSMLEDYSLNLKIAKNQIRNHTEAEIKKITEGQAEFRRKVSLFIKDMLAVLKGFDGKDKTLEKTLIKMQGNITAGFSIAVSDLKTQVQEALKIVNIRVSQSNGRQKELQNTAARHMREINQLFTTTQINYSKNSANKNKIEALLASLTKLETETSDAAAALGDNISKKVMEMYKVKGKLFEAIKESTEALITESESKTNLLRTGLKTELLDDISKKTEAVKLYATESWMEAAKQRSTDYTNLVGQIDRIRGNITLEIFDVFQSRFKEINSQFEKIKTNFSDDKTAKVIFDAGYMKEKKKLEKLIEDFGAFKENIALILGEQIETLTKAIESGKRSPYFIELQRQAILLQAINEKQDNYKKNLKAEVKTQTSIQLWQMNNVIDAQTGRIRDLEKAEAGREQKLTQHIETVETAIAGVTKLINEKDTKWSKEITKRMNGILSSLTRTLSWELQPFKNQVTESTTKVNDMERQVVYAVNIIADTLLGLGVIDDNDAKAIRKIEKSSQGLLDFKKKLAEWVADKDGDSSRLKTLENEVQMLQYPLLKDALVQLDRSINKKLLSADVLKRISESRIDAIANIDDILGGDKELQKIFPPSYFENIIENINKEAMTPADKLRDWAKKFRNLGKQVELRKENAAKNKADLLDKIGKAAKFFDGIVKDGLLKRQEKEAESAQGYFEDFVKSMEELEKNP